MLEALRILGSILFIDVILSGDNALVISTVASSLPANLRWIAFVVGGGGAITLRIALTYSVTLLLRIPLLQTIGGVLLLVITIRLLLVKDEKAETSNSDTLRSLFDRVGSPVSARSAQLIGACLTVLFADASTSVDNIIAVAALAKDNPLLLVIGLVLSILLLLIGSVLLSIFMRRVPWIILIAAVILAATAAHMIVQDTQSFITPILMTTAATIWWDSFVYLIAFVFTAIAASIWCRNHLWA